MLPFFWHYFFLTEQGLLFVRGKGNQWGNVHTKNNYKLRGNKLKVKPARCEGLIKFQEYKNGHWQLNHLVIRF